MTAKVTSKVTNKVIPITLLGYHIRKLEMMCKRTELSKTGVIQRLIESHSLFNFEKTEDED